MPPGWTTKSRGKLSAARATFLSLSNRPGTINQIEPIGEEKMPAVRFCDQCGTRLSNSFVKFCPSCGEALDLSAAVRLALPDAVVEASSGAEEDARTTAESSAPASDGKTAKRASSRAFGFVGAIAVAAFCVWFYFTPHLAVNAMKSAADARDAVKFSQHINRPALRDSLRSALSAKLVGESSGGRNADPVAALGASMAAAFIDPAIDKLMSPEGLAMLMAGGPEPPSKRNRKSPDPIANLDTSMAYESFNSFVVTIREKVNKGDAIGLVFNRDGVFSWKLAAVRL
jgi:hypothetical protein